MNRRQFLAGAAALALTRDVRAAVPIPVVLVLLRGALDSLAAVPLLADPRMKSLRSSLDTSAGALPLDRGVGLHPSLARTHRRIKGGGGAVLLGVGPSSHGRSHFEAQDTLETAGVRGSGWLNRVGGARGTTDPLAVVSLTQSQPVSLSGPTPSVCLANPGRQDLSLEQITDLKRMYTGSTDPAAIQALRGLDALVRVRSLPVGTFDSQNGATAAFRNAGRLIGAGLGTVAAFVEFTGWDTHTRQGGLEGTLAKNLAKFDEALDALLVASAGTALVLVMTEFGRTVAQNGGAGTDHGHGAAAFVFGPGVRPGVLGEVPDLGALHEGRDLPVPHRQEAVLAAATRHLGIATDLTGGVPPMPGIFG